MSRNYIEEIILEMENIVLENRTLKQKLKDMELDLKRYKAIARRDFDEADRLGVMVSNNLGVKLANSCGWITNSELEYDD